MVGMVRKYERRGEQLGPWNIKKAGWHCSFCVKGIRFIIHISFMIMFENFVDSNSLYIFYFPCHGIVCIEQKRFAQCSSEATLLDFYHPLPP